MFAVRLVVLLVAHCEVVSTLTCFWCSGVDSDRLCETKPREVISYPVAINCSTRYCISSKVMDAVSGEVRSFARLCDNIPRGNVCVRDSHLITCFETCTSDLCNSGNPDPSYLPIRPYAAAFLGLPEVVISKTATPRRNNKLHEYYSGKSNKPKSSPDIQRTQNVDTNPPLSSRKIIPESDTKNVRLDRDMNKKARVKINTLRSSQLTSPSKHKDKNLRQDFENGTNKHNLSGIHVSPFSSIAKSGTVPAVQRGKEKGKEGSFSRSSKSKFQKIKNLWWEQADINHTKTEDTVESSVQEKNDINKFGNNISDKHFMANKENIQRKDMDGMKPLTTGDNRDNLRLSAFSSNNFPLLQRDANVSYMLPPWTANKVQKDRQKTLENHAKSTGSGDHVASETNVSKWWEKSTLQTEDSIAQKKWLQVSKHLQNETRFSENTPKVENSSRHGGNYLDIYQGHERKFTKGNDNTNYTLVKVATTGHPHKRPSNLNKIITDFNAASVPFPENSKTELEKATNRRSRLQQNYLSTQNSSRTFRVAGNKSKTPILKLEPRNGLFVAGASQPFRASLGNIRRQNRNLNSSVWFQEEPNAYNHPDFSGKNKRPMKLSKGSTVSPVTRDTQYSKDMPLIEQRARNSHGVFLRNSMSNQTLDFAEKKKIAQKDYQNESARKKVYALVEVSHHSLFPAHVTKYERDSHKKKLFQTAPSNAKQSHLRTNNAAEEVSSRLSKSNVKKSQQQGRFLKPIAVPYDNHPPVLYLRPDNVTSHASTTLALVSTSSALSSQLTDNSSSMKSITSTEASHAQTLQTDGYNTSTNSSLIQPGLHDTATAQTPLMHHQPSDFPKDYYRTINSQKENTRLLNLIESDQNSTDIKQLFKSTETYISQGQLSEPISGIAESDRKSKNMSKPHAELVQGDAKVSKTKVNVSPIDTNKLTKHHTEDVSIQALKKKSDDSGRKTENTEKSRLDVKSPLSRIDTTGATRRPQVKVSQTQIETTVINRTYSHKTDIQKTKTDKQETDTQPTESIKMNTSLSGIESPQRPTVTKKNGTEKARVTLTKRVTLKVDDVGGQHSDKEYIDEKPLLSAGKISINGSYQGEMTDLDSQADKPESLVTGASSASSTERTSNKMSSLSENAKITSNGKNLDPKLPSIIGAGYDNSGDTNVRNNSVTGSSSNTTNIMADGSHSGHGTRLPTQRIYLRKNVYKPGRNEKFHSEASTFMSDKNLATDSHHVTSYRWLLIFLGTCILLV